MKFQIRYGMGGGFGGAGDWEEIECLNLEEAQKEARERAVETYQSYEGLHGIRDLEMIMEQDDLGEADAEEVYWEEVNSWIDYDAREFVEETEQPIGEK